jgi:hypothetical protein
MFIGPSFIFIIFTSLITIPINAFAQTDDGYVTFGKSIYGVSIKHPTDWHVEEGSDRSTRDDRVGYDLIASLCPNSTLEYPYKDTMPNLSHCRFINEVVFSTANLPKNTSLDEYVSFVESSAKFSFTDYKIENLTDITVSGLPAKKLVYTYFDQYQGQDEFIKTLEVIALSGDKSYEITYKSPHLQFDDLFPIVQRMIDSIKILPMPPCNFVKNENVSTSYTFDQGKCVLRA